MVSIQLFGLAVCLVAVGFVEGGLINPIPPRNPYPTIPRTQRPPRYPTVPTRTQPVRGHALNHIILTKDLTCPGKFGTESPPRYPTVPTVTGCITSCDGIPDGDYQSCISCLVYASCGGGIFYDNRPCAPASPHLVWDDNVKRCEYVSATCGGGTNNNNDVCWDAKGRGYKANEKIPYDNHCKECVCFASGEIKCIELIDRCPPLTCASPVTTPGSCCPHCPRYDCVDSYGNVYQAGDNVPCVDKCDECTCYYNGSIICRRKDCPPPPCPLAFQVTRIGDCCPSCRYKYGCYHNGTHYQIDEKVPNDDPCKWCTCEANGHVNCVTKQCPPTACTYEKIPPGHCCPVCIGCTHYGKQHLFGEDVHSYDPCEDCTCEKDSNGVGVINCVTRGCPEPDCEYKERKPGACCETCIDRCYYEGTNYYIDEKVPNDDPCKWCTCEANGHVNCVTTQCPPTACTYEQTPPGHCCPVCIGCTHYGKQHLFGEDVHSYDPCEDCTCEKDSNGVGVINCVTRGCPEPDCEYKEQKPGACCETCIDRCYYEGTNYYIDEKVPNDDPCKWCTCEANGHVNCVTTQCPPTACTYEQTPPGHCCPVCIGCTHYGTQHLFGEAVHSYDPCEDCTCEKDSNGVGVVKCVTRGCPEPDCEYKELKPGACCETCKEGCHHEGTYYDIGDNVPCEDECTRCTCVRIPYGLGKIDCVKIPCPPRTCHLGLTTPPGYCCPICKECWLSKPNSGSCIHQLWRYYYDSRTKQCKKFFGCQGSGYENNFASLELCKQACN